MRTHIIEATNGPRNWGKFLIGRFEEKDFKVPSAVSGVASILYARGHSKREVLVLDLETCEGALFTLGGFPSADLDKHKIWVCPLFEPFLTWLYTQDLSDFSKLPTHVDLPDAPFELQGHRRTGDHANKLS